MRGTTQDQDGRFTNKEKKLIKLMKFDQILSVPIDMGKVIVDTLKPWIAARVCELLGFEDEVVIDYIYEMLETEKPPNPQKMQIHLTGFLEAKNARIFMRELWALLLSAQNNNGIPRELIEAKKEEILAKQKEQEKLDKIVKTSITAEKVNPQTSQPPNINVSDNNKNIQPNDQQKINKPLYKPKEFRRDKSDDKDQRVRGESRSPRREKRRRSNSFRGQDSNDRRKYERPRSYRDEDRKSRYDSDQSSSRRRERSSSADHRVNNVIEKSKIRRKDAEYDDQRSRVDRSISRSPSRHSSRNRTTRSKRSPAYTRRTKSRSLEKSKDIDRYKTSTKFSNNKEKSKHSDNKRYSRNSRSSSDDASSTSYSSSSNSSRSTNTRSDDETESLETSLRIEALKSLERKMEKK